jgi:HK97 family phage portal protein
MLSPDAYEEHCRRLEEGRARRHGQTWPGRGVGPLPGQRPVEIAPGRGDLNYTSWNGGWPQAPTGVPLVPYGWVSFANIFQTQPWVAAAVMRMLTWAVRVPLKAYRRGSEPNDRERLRPGNHRVATMITNPWKGASQAQLVMALLGPVLVHGNSVTEVRRVTRTRIELDPHDWRYCQPVMPNQNTLEGFQFNSGDGTLERDVALDRVLHMAWWSPIGPPKNWIGTSPLQQLGVTLGIENAAQRYSASLYQWGGRPPSAVTINDAALGMKADERREIMAQVRRDISELYGGPENMGKPALLGPGVDWKILGGSAVEAELIDMRRVSREEVAAVYLIPPPMMGILDRATYSNIKTQREMTYTDVLGPPLVLIEQMINGKIIRDLLGQDDCFVEFDFGAVLRGDRLEEINALRQAISSALMSPNEARYVLNMPRIEEEGMSEHWLPVNNLQPVTAAFARAHAVAETEREAEEAEEETPPEEIGETPEARAHRLLHVMMNGREYVLTANGNGH